MKNKIIQIIKSSWFWANQAVLIAGLIIGIAVFSVFLYMMVSEGANLNIVILGVMSITFMIIGVWYYYKEGLAKRKAEMENLEEVQIEEDTD